MHWNKKKKEKKKNNQDKFVTYRGFSLASSTGKVFDD